MGSETGFENFRRGAWHAGAPLRSGSLQAGPRPISRWCLRFGHPPCQPLQERPPPARECIFTPLRSRSSQMDLMVSGHGPFLLVDGLVCSDCVGTSPPVVCRLDQEALPGSQQVQVMETVHPHGRLKTELGKGSIRLPSRYPHCEVIFMAMAQGGMNPAANPAGLSNRNAHGSPIHASPVLTN